jgi:DNA-binding MarR family transcriptional regulator
MTQATASESRPAGELLGREFSTAIVMFHEAVGRLMGLSAVERKCIDVLRRLGPVTAGTIGEHTGLTTGAVTGLMDRLEKAGYVRRERDKADRRVVWLLTTDEGLARAQRIADRAVDAHSALVPALTPELETAIRGFLITVIENDLAIVQENPSVSETELRELRRPQC